YILMYVIKDRHAVGNQIEIDESQDYILEGARENSTHTFLSFSRPFDTCDKDHDLPIDYDYIAVIWAFGEKDDDLENHFHNRGVYDAYLLDATLTPNLDELNSSEKSKSSRDLSLWTISMEQEIPAQDTAYICTMHKAPSHRTKQHIVGFRSVLPTELEVRHIHHFLLHRCVAPEGKDPVALFDQFVGQPGQECYVLTNPNPFPTQYCRQVAHEWAVGAYPIFFPDHVGIPLSESPNEYYLLQMHYDNPEVLSGLQLRFSLEVYYTSILRQHDLGLMYVGKATPGSPTIVIPPSELNHTVYGQCGSGCTNLMLPKSGIHVVAAKLHTHLAGRGMRLIHIRNNEELPWLSYDDNYNFNFQPIRLLREERTILPGDQLVISRCTYETTDRNGSVTVGGFSTRNEMCNGFIWFYNKLNGFAGVCSSEIRSETYKNFLQISNTTWSDARRENVVTAPRQNAGLLVSQAGNRIYWTIERRNQLQYYHRYLPQVSGCPRLLPDEQSELQLPARGRFSNRKRTLRRNALLDTSFKNEQTELVTMYPENIVPYSRPQLCTK
ncbi:DBH-like monooxygenase protein 1, partial [Orchesella cincta]